MADEYGDEAEFAALANTIDPSPAQASTSNGDRTKVQQPKPQSLPGRAGPSSIIVSTRQKGNPSLNYIRNVPWEYGDIPADYVLGATTCALFLSLKYHRLHPEYVYARIRNLGHKYRLRVLLTMVDIQNHEESLKELSKTSLVNDLTLILCWSAQEAGRYLELYKSYEHASPTSIRAHQATSYSEKLIEFVTVPRSVNKTDAVSLVSAFGSVRAAVSARPEEIGDIAGWGEKKVQRWCGTVREPFRVRKAAKRRVGLAREESSMDRPQNGLEAEVATLTRESSALRNSHNAIPVSSVPTRDTLDDVAGATTQKKPADEDFTSWEDDEAALLAAAEDNALQAGVRTHSTAPQSDSKKTLGNAPDPLSDGVAAALAKLRQHEG